jgi:hypothetical protein
VESNVVKTSFFPTTCPVEGTARSQSISQEVVDHVLDEGGVSSVVFLRLLGCPEELRGRLVTFFSTTQNEMDEFSLQAQDQLRGPQARELFQMLNTSTVQSRPEFLRCSKDDGSRMVASFEEIKDLVAKYENPLQVAMAKASGASSADELQPVPQRGVRLPSFLQAAEAPAQQRATGATPMKALKPAGVASASQPAGRGTAVPKAAASVAASRTCGSMMRGTSQVGGSTRSRTSATGSVRGGGGGGGGGPSGSGGVRLSLDAGTGSNDEGEQPETQNSLESVYPSISIMKILLGEEKQGRSIAWATR